MYRFKKVDNKWMNEWMNDFRLSMKREIQSPKMCVANEIWTFFVVVVVVYIHFNIVILSNDFFYIYLFKFNLIRFVNDGGEKN